MKGVSFTVDQSQTSLMATIDTLMLDEVPSIEMFEQYVDSSEFRGFKIDKDAILSIVEQLRQAELDASDTVIKQSIAHLPTADFSFEISSDEMSATLTLTKGLNNSVPTIKEIQLLAASQGIKRGLSKKRITNLLDKLIDEKPGATLSEDVAFGLPPRNGRNSYIMPLVPNALDRVLTPQATESGKVDMRNLGEIISVGEHMPVAKRMPPSKGRIGKTITGLDIEPIAGEWQDIKLGENTAISDSDLNVIVSIASGQPKFENGIMSVDDTYTCKGVNVGTGNINYQGSVIVNGDVTESMEIVATGDITINGFVESAMVRAGGDIIITQGATGKMQDEDCRLIANGNIFVQHGQGLDVICAKNLNVGKQLAYSRIKCKGNINIGKGDNPNGSIFASTVNTYGTIRAGTVGAVSGSALNIDFSEGLALLEKRHDSLSELLRDLTKNNANHEIKVANLNHRIIPANLKQKLNSLNDHLTAERILLNWVRDAKTELESKIEQYETNARIVANKELFPGVTIKLNKAVFRAEREYQRVKIVSHRRKWTVEPF